MTVVDGHGEPIEIIEKFDFPFEVAFSHWDASDGYENNAIYFYPSDSIVSEAIEKSKTRANRMYVLDSLTNNTVLLDWRARYLSRDEIDIVFKGPFRETRGYYFRDINVALFTDITHLSNAYSINMLRELSIVLNKLHEEYRNESHK